MKRALASLARINGLALFAALVFASLPMTSTAAAAPIALGIATSPPLSTTLTQQYIQAAGAPPQIEMWFRDFDAPLFYSSELATVKSVGATPMITWDPMAGRAVVPFAEITAGKYDSYLRSQADYAAQTHKLIYIRLAHEMNVRSAATPWGPGRNGNTPARYVAAWRHVVTLFREQRATNVKWVWAPNDYCGGACPFGNYYPGDAWVDYAGLDAYNFAATHHIAWMSFAEIFGPSYKVLTSLTAKPVMFTETASTGIGGNKAQWITQGFLHDIPTLFPRVVAVIWWQRIDQTDWRVNSSAASAAAWRAVVASPLYGRPNNAKPARHGRHTASHAARRQR